MADSDTPADDQSALPTKPAEANAATGEKGAPDKKKKLTPEEQMAAFEKAMKEEDWGHQPC